MKAPRILIASDHAGWELKNALQKTLPQWTWEDLGPITAERVDYPDFAEKLARKLLKDGCPLGILICGSGVGMCIAANKVSGIRAAHAESVETARLAREHNDANVLCLGARQLSTELATQITRTFLETPFSGDSRHRGRIEKITHLDKRR